jgi:hypothetical protein
LQAIALSDPPRGAQTTRIWAASVLIEIQPMSAPNDGGSARAYLAGSARRERSYHHEVPGTMASVPAYSCRLRRTDNARI